MIAGVPVGPFAANRQFNCTSKDRTAVGAALRSDFAVDHVSRQPVSGAVSSIPAATIRSDSRSGGIPAGAPACRDQWNRTASETDAPATAAAAPGYAVPTQAYTPTQRSSQPATHVVRRLRLRSYATSRIRLVHRHRHLRSRPPPASRPMPPPAPHAVPMLPRPPHRRDNRR